MKSMAGTLRTSIPQKPMLSTIDFSGFQRMNNLLKDPRYLLLQINLEWNLFQRRSSILRPLSSLATSVGIEPLQQGGDAPLH
jgi:hypothetical protein